MPLRFSKFWDVMQVESRTPERVTFLIPRMFKGKHIHYRYTITCLGEVSGGRYRKVLTPVKDADGYTNYIISRYTVRGAALLLWLFDRPAKENEVATHRNGICNDDRLINLKWATQKNNIHDKYTHGTMGGKRGPYNLTRKTKQNDACND